ncbi:hypothetical protein [Paenibacillus sp. Soil724D2]|uniref:hypothetical protein n=1 Tax=Paenibacillus sp. (strain Soil724D2) TaxID=1736392 RepID=UPI0007159766|nr:hypothetical protein [Paenibacillus sp. Soil724D2]KRE50665.1 hypothetical protein ASG85_20665 [Paenibacillus sp. Soil724D2]
MEAKLIEVFGFLGLENELYNEDYVSFHFVEERIEATVREELNLKRSQIGDSTELDIERIADLLSSCKGLQKEDDMYELIYTKPFLIQIPASLNHILINRVGPSIIPHATITRLWEQQVPYVLKKDMIVYREHGHLVQEKHEGQKLLRAVKGAYYRMAFDMDSFSSQHNSESEHIQKHTETVTLPNGDLIIMHFAENMGGIVEMSHMMKGPL